jgi:hypothetical protein
MILPRVSEWEHNKHSFGGKPCGLVIGTVALILFPIWFLGATATARATALGGQDGSVQADRPINQTKPGQQAADAKASSGSTAGETDAQAAQAQIGQQSPAQIEIEKAKQKDAQSDERKGE